MHTCLNICMHRVYTAEHNIFVLVMLDGLTAIAPLNKSEKLGRVNIQLTAILGNLYIMRIRS